MEREYITYFVCVLCCFVMLFCVWRLRPWGCRTHAPGRTTFSFNALDFHVACTPQGCIELLDRHNIPIEGKEAVVIGRSNIVGIPVAMLLLQRNATLTIAHSRTDRKSTRLNSSH